jgi:hypothetical protein
MALGGQVLRVKDDRKEIVNALLEFFNPFWKGTNECLIEAYQIGKQIVANDYCFSLNLQFLLHFGELLLYGNLAKLGVLGVFINEPIDWNL